MTAVQTIPTMATIQQAAELTGISEWCIRRLAKSRKIKAICSGRKIIINLNSLQTFLEESEFGHEWGEGNG
jgi:excisionase family DNA binding protein